MPIEKETKLVKLKPQVLRRLNEQFESGKRKAPDFTNFVNDLLMDFIEKDEFLKVYAPSYSNYGIHDNMLLIKDSKADIIAEITLRNNILHCNIDRSTDCMHVKFALALPEVARLKKLELELDPIAC